MVYYWLPIYVVLLLFAIKFGFFFPEELQITKRKKKSHFLVLALTGLDVINEVGICDGKERERSE